MTEPSPADLMRYHDGEMPPEELARVEAWLSSHPVAREQVSGIAQVGDFVRAAVDARAQSGPDVTDAVMARIDADDAAAAAPGLRRVGGSPGAGLDSVGRRGDFRRAAAWLGGLAAAAGVLLALRATGPRQQVAPVEARAPAASSSAREATSGIEAVTVAQASIESVDFGSNSGSIFMVSSGSQTTPVVWLMEVGEGGDRMGPL